MEATKKVRVYPEKPQVEGKYIERARTLPRTTGLVGSSTPLHGWTALYWLLMMVNSLLATWEGPEVRCGEFWEGSKLETEAPSASTVIMKERNTFVERGSLPVCVLHGQSPQSEQDPQVSYPLMESLNGWYLSPCILWIPHADKIVKHIKRCSKQHCPMPRVQKPFLQEHVSP